MSDNSDQQATLLQSSLQCSVVNAFLQTAWIGCIGIIATALIMQQWLEAGAVFVLTLIIVSLRFFVFEKVKSLTQLDWISLGLLVPCAMVVLLAYRIQMHNQVVASLTVLGGVGSLMIYRSEIYWTWLVLFGLSYVCLSLSLGQLLPSLEWSFVGIIIPMAAIVLRKAVCLNYQNLVAQTKTNDALVQDLTTSLRATREQTRQTITAKKQLLANKAKLKAVLDRAPLNLFVFDLDGVCIQANGNELSDVGIDSTRAVGKKCQAIFQAYPEVFESLVESTSGKTVKLRISSMSQRHYDFRFEPMLDESGEIESIFAVSIDVTDAVQSEIQQQAYEKLQLHSHKMENLGLLAGTVAHDFNNYLTAIVSFSESLIDTSDNKSRPIIQQIRQTALKAANVSDQMLAYSSEDKDGSGILKPLELNELVRDMEPFLRAVSPKSTRLVIEPASSELWIEGSDLEIQQLVMNVLKNANDASKRNPNAEVRVRIRKLEGLSPKSRLRIGQTDLDGPLCAIEIRDNGIGIGDNDLKRISDPYFTTKSEGHGLGMAIAKRVAVAHRGAIEIEQIEPTGTCMRLIFPIQEPVEGLDEEHSTDLSDSLNIGRVVLLVDDEQRVLDSVSMLLEAKGQKVIAVNSAKDALAEMELYHDEIDILIFDFSMPEINGLELLNRVRAEGWNHPAILCSGYVMRLDDHPNAQFWPDETLAKPYKFKQLQLAMDKVCRGKLGRV